MNVDWDAMILVGRIARTHGIRGQVIVTPETDFVEARFTEGATFWTKSAAGAEQLTISSARLQNGRPVVAFEGVSSIDDAERLAGQELRVPEAALTPLEAGTYYHHQLVGCAVETTAGEAVGEVARVDGGQGGSLLVVHGRRSEVLIPLAAHICVRIDVEGRRITVELPEGLLELNEKSTGPSEGGPHGRKAGATRGDRL
jgi:16S rRNA processing protein RimM